MRLIADPAKGTPGADLHANLGAMREWVELRPVTRSKGAGGYASDIATTEDTVPAEVVNDGGTEPFQTGALRGQRRYLIRIRYRADVQAGWRVGWCDETLEVLEAPIADSRRRFLWLRCGVVEPVST